MKARESGMPEEEIWERFFDVSRILNELEINKSVELLIELGFGYGTFTIPASRIIKGNLYTYDIESQLTNELKKKLNFNNINNVYPQERDFITEGTGLENDLADYVMLFNILHAEETENILKETYRILKKNGKVGVIHWNYNDSTPRGPSMDIRPRPEDLNSLLVQSGFNVLKSNINLLPYHYGILAVK